MTHHPVHDVSNPEVSPAPGADGLHILKFLERFDAGLIAAGFTHAQRMTIVGLMFDTPTMPAGSLESPRPPGMLTEEESAFVLRVVQCPGGKLGDMPANNQWEVPEQLGMVKCVGSWKWEPTPSLMGLLLSAIATRNPGVAVSSAPVVEGAKA